MSKLANNTAYLTIASIGQKAIAFVYFAIIARVLGVESTGTYFLALSLTTMVGVLADFGLTPVLIREVAKHPNDQQTYLSRVVGLKTLLSVIAAIVIVIMSYALGYDMVTRSLIYTAIAVMILDTFHLTYYGVFRGRHTLGFESIGIFVGQLVTLTIGGLSLLIAPNPMVLIMALLGGSLWNVAFSASRLKKAGLHPYKPVWDKTFAKTLLLTALPFALAAIFVKVYSSVDVILLERFLGDEAVGLYSIAYKLTYAFQFLPMAFVAALYPSFSRLIKEQKKAELEGVFYQSMWYMAILAVPVVFGLFSVADIVVPLIYGSDYLGSVLPLQILIFGLLLIFLDFPIGSLLNADDRQVTKTAIMGGTMVINVTANAILIPQFGVVGAPISALLGFIWLLGAGLVATRKSLNFSYLQLIREIGPIFAVGLAMLFVVLLTKQYLGIAVVGLGAIVYVIGLFGLNIVTISQLRQFAKGLKRS